MNILYQLRNWLNGNAKPKPRMADDGINLVNSYRERFKDSPAGTWISAEGTFSMQSDTFEFFEDGTGSWLSESGASEKLIKFQWRKVAPQTIAIRDDDEENWIEIEYDFKQIETDISREIILCQKGSDYFYMANTRVALKKEPTEGRWP